MKMTLVVLFVALLASCREDVPLPTQSLAEQIKTLEDTGAYPKHDRSTDLKGPDQNLNGVRDDIEAWIASQPMTEKQKRAAMFEAAVFQKKLLVDLTDKAAVQKLMDESLLAAACMADAYYPDIDESFKIGKQMEALNTSTKERLIRYMKFGAARSGMSVRYPTNYTCP